MKHMIKPIRQPMCYKKHLSSESTSSSSSSPATTTLSIFFSECDILRKSHALLSSLGFDTIAPPGHPKSSRLLGPFQTARISSGPLVIELISDPLFSRLRKSYGKRDSFARVIEIKRSFGNKGGREGEAIVPPSGSTVFSGLYPFTAIISTFPHNVPLFTVQESTISGEKIPNGINNIENIPINIPMNIPKHFSGVKEIIIPCSTKNFEIMDTVQTALVDTFGAVPLGSRLPGLFGIALSSEERLIVRTAPTNVCTIILKVDNLASASSTLKSLSALGDCMGHSGTACNGQIQVKIPGLDGGVEFRVTDSDVVSAFYAEPPQSVVEDTLPEMQNSRVMMEGGGKGEVKVDIPLVATGDCWKEVRVQLRNATK